MSTKKSNVVAAKRTLVGSGIFNPTNSNNNNKGTKSKALKREEEDTNIPMQYTEDEFDVETSISVPNLHLCDLWYRKENGTQRRSRIVFMEFIQALWYNTIVGIGFRMLGNSWSFGLLQGFAFTSMVCLFWYDDFGFANIFVTMGLCFSRQLRSKEYWIFFLHFIGQIIGTALAMAGVILVTNDLPGLQTFGAPTKSSIISETSAGFSEFVGSFLIGLVIFFCVFKWNDSVKMHFKEERERQEKKRKNRYYKTPTFAIGLGLAYTAVSIGFYDLTGSSFNFLRWAISRLCMGNFDLNPHDALYYLVANFFGIGFAGLVVYLAFYFKNKAELKFLKNVRDLDRV